MRPISSTESSSLSFDEQNEGKKFLVQNEKISWIHTLSDAPGAKFDLVIKDALGRPIFERKDFGTETTQAGELVNLPVHMGEEMEVSVKNIRGAKKIDLFLN